MNKKSGIGESKPKQSRREGESALELPVRRADAVEPLAVGKMLKSRWLRIFEQTRRILKKRSIESFAKISYFRVKFLYEVAETGF